MAYSVQITKSAHEELRALPLNIQNRIKSIIDTLSENHRPHGSVKLEGGKDLFRIRSGSYRVVYTIKKDTLIILVVKIGNRNEIYRDILRIKY